MTASYSELFCGAIAALMFLTHSSRNITGFFAAIGSFLLAFYSDFAAFCATKTLAPTLTIKRDLANSTSCSFMLDIQFIWFQYFGATLIQLLQCTKYLGFSIWQYTIGFRSPVCMMLTIISQQFGVVLFKYKVGQDFLEHYQNILMISNHKLIVSFAIQRRLVKVYIPAIQPSFAFL